METAAARVSLSCLREVVRKEAWVPQAAHSAKAETYAGIDFLLDSNAFEHSVVAVAVV